MLLRLVLGLDRRVLVAELALECFLVAGAAGSVYESLP